MKYLTKEYYKDIDDLMPFDTMFNLIEDKSYSDEEIKEMYEKEKEKFISENEEYYNTAPENEEYEEALGLELEDILIGDLSEDGTEENLRRPSSWDEYYLYKETEHQRNLEEFMSRPPFDKRECEKDFEDSYQTFLDKESHDFPEFVFEQVDMRLLAMNLMPKSVHKKLEKENKKREKLIEKKEKEVKKRLKKHTDYTVYEILEDYFRSYNNLVEIKVDKNGKAYFYLNDKERFLSFENPEFLENEVATCHDRLYVYGHEVYDVEEGYEVHFVLFDDRDGEYKYITVKCSNLSFALKDE